MTHADDLFAGAGGWDLAASALGIHARGVENMPEARATRDAAGLTTIHDDVWTFTPPGDADGQITSPPCPTFSQAGGGSGRRAMTSVLSAVRDGAYKDLDALRAYPVADNDDRTRLVLTPLHFALRGGYRWLAWEQVPSVLPVWQVCAEVLRTSGWSVWTGLLHAEQYGVPQTRKRAFLIASQDHLAAPPTPTHSRYHPHAPRRLDADVLPWVPMATALQWPPLEPGPCTCEVTLTATNPRPNACHRTPCQPAPTMAFGHEQPRWNPRETLPDGTPRWHDQSGTAYDPSWPDLRPATVVAGRDLVQNPGATANRFNGSTKSRNDGVRVTPSEAGVLQSFPADHPWSGSKAKRYLQAGNAVPPLMGRAVLAAAAVGTPSGEAMLF